VWPEIYLNGVGWVVVDIAPERSLEPPNAEPDAAVQQALGEVARKTQPVDHAESSEGKGDRARVTAAQIYSAGALAGLLLLAIAYGSKGYRALAPYLARRDRVYRVGYRAAADRLSEVGYRRAIGESRESFARRAAALAPSFSALTRTHLGPPLGTREPADAAMILRLSSEVGREVRRGTPAWRFALGALDPFSWLRTR
jgi:hypothetical protein